MKFNDFVNKIEEIAPLNTEESWDNSGVQIKVSDEVKRVLVSLDVTSKVISEASKRKCDMILTHHPLFFGDLNRISQDEPKGKLAIKLISKGISLYSIHTPFDKCENGLNDYLGEILDINNIMPSEYDPSGFVKIGDPKSKDITMKAFIKYASKKLSIDMSHISFVGDKDAVIKKIAWCTGSGGEFISIAKKAGANLFITGDVKYHVAQEAKELGINVLDLGHFGTENIFVKDIINLLGNIKDIEIIESNTDINPFEVL